LRLRFLVSNSPSPPLRLPLLDYEHSISFTHEEVKRYVIVSRYDENKRQHKRESTARYWQTNDQMAAEAASELKTEEGDILVPGDRKAKKR